MTYKVYFKSDNEIYRLPVNPEEINIDYGMEIQEYDILKFGKIGFAGNEKLAKYSFDFELPGRHYSYIAADSEYRIPNVYLDMFKHHMKSKKPVGFTAYSETAEDSINVDVLISTLKVAEKAGEEGDYYCSVELTSYKHYAAELLENISESISGSHVTRDINPPLPSDNIHVVQSGDTLWALAKKYLGKGSRYTELAELNNIKNPGLIYPGQKITIPGE